MRILIIQHGVFPGFVAPIAKELAKNLWHSGVDVSVAAVGDHEAGVGGAAGTFGFPVHYVRAVEPWLAYRALQPLVGKADIVHYFPGRGLELLPLLNRRVKYIFNHISVSVTGIAWKDRMINLGKRLQPALADLIIATDPALAHALRPVNSVPVAILPVGFPGDLFYPCRPFVDGSERLLIYHGACRPQRRLEKLIDVVAKLPLVYRLVIIGGGSKTDDDYRTRLAEYAERLGCRDRVQLTNMPQIEIRGIIERAWLCLSYVPVIDCFQDQFVLKSNEYLACQRPVLTTATRYNLEFQKAVGVEHLLVSADEIDAMVEAILNAEPWIREFHKPKNLERLSNAMVKYTSAEVVKRQLIPIYERLLGVV